MDKATDFYKEYFSPEWDSGRGNVFLSTYLAMFEQQLRTGDNAAAKKTLDIIDFDKAQTKAGVDMEIKLLLLNLQARTHFGQSFCDKKAQQFVNPSW